VTQKLSQPLALVRGDVDLSVEIIPMFNGRHESFVGIQVGQSWDKH